MRGGTHAAGHFDGDGCTFPTPGHFVPSHAIHDYGSNGRCRVIGCRVYDPSEDDDRIDGDDE
jgi:hypothetical protein